MICEVCISYEGDSQDNLIRFICNHHPSCPDFKIDKGLFFSEFQRQVETKSALRLAEIYVPELKQEGKEERASNKITKRLYSFLSARYFPIVPNSYIFDWESDLLAVNKDSQYITEYEIKISRNDFKADFLKSEKHKLIGDCYEWKFSSDIPNFFYYATPPGLLNKFEIPAYAGLMEIGLNVRIVKRAPLLHKNIISQIQIDNLMKKVYYKYWNKQQI